MALPVRIHLWLLVFSGATVLRGNASLTRYLPLISDVGRHYFSARIYLAVGRQDPHSHEYRLAYTLSRRLSRRGSQTSIIPIEETFERINSYDKSEVRPLMAVIFTAVEDIDAFAKNTQRSLVSFPIWLMIFAGDWEPAVCEYCDKPVGNIFHLRFDTEMLVSCCREPAMREWWSVAENETRVAALGGERSSENRPELPKDRNLYERRRGVEGVGLRVAVVTTSAFHDNEDGKFSGYFYEILMELQRVMNFEITEILERKEFGSWNSASENWTGVIEQVHEGRADLGVAEFKITAHRTRAIDFTLPLHTSRARLFVKKMDGSEVQWSAYFKAFSFQIWMAILVLACATTLVVALIELTKGVDSFLRLFVEHYLDVWGIFCQQGLAVFSVETPLRIAYCSTFVSALVVSAAYSGALTSFITVSSDAPPFTSIEEFAEDGSYRLVVLRNSSDFDLFAYQQDSVMMKVRNLMKPLESLPRTVEEGFGQVCTEKVAFFVTEAAANKWIEQVPCKFAGINTGIVDNSAIILSPGSQYTGIINYYIGRFQESGMLDRLKNIYLTKPREFKAKYNQVNIWGVAPLLIILAGGTSLALVVLFLEYLYEWLSKLKRKTREIDRR